MSAADQAYTEGTRKMLTSKDCAHERTETIKAGHLIGLVRCLDCTALNPKPRTPVLLITGPSVICADRYCKVVFGSEAHLACRWADCPMGDR